MIAHEYFGVIPAMVFDIIKTDLPKLEDDIIHLIRHKEDKSKLMQALDDAIDELLQMNRGKSVSYLNAIKNQIS